MQNSSRYLIVFSIASVFAISPLLAQSFWQPTNGPYGGMTRGVAMDSQNRVYAATANGIFFSTDNGTKWIATFTSLPQKNALQIAVLPGDIYIVVSAGGTIYRSTDGGAHWTLTASLGSISTASGIVEYNGAYSLAIDGSSAFVDGVYRSTDDGATWSQTGPALVGTDPASIAVNSSNGYLYVNTIQNGVYRSTNNGGTWMSSNTGINLTWKFGYAICAADDGSVYAGFSSWSQGSPVVIYDGGIYRSTNYGGSWTQSNIGVINPDVHYLAASSHGEIFAIQGQENGTLFKSADNGSSWHAAGIGNLSSWPGSVIRPPLVFFSSSAGMVRSSNNGDTWDILQEGLMDNLITAVAPGTGSTIWSGTVGSGAYHTSDGGNIWTPRSSGIGIPTILSIARTKNGSLLVGTETDGIYTSTDEGLTWARKNPDVSGASISSIVVSDSGHIFCGGLFAYRPGGVLKFIKYAIMRSTDEGETWTFSSDTGNTQMGAVSIAVGNNSVLYATTQGSEIYRSSDHGWSWVRLSVTFPVSPYMMVYCDRQENSVFIGAQKGLFASFDDGANWRPVDTTYNSVLNWSMVKRCNTMLVSTDAAGIRMSTDNGASWSSVNSGLDGKNVRALHLANDRYLYAGTSGGVYRSVYPLSNLPASPTLLAPPDSAVSVPLDVPLQWATVCRAESYHVQVATDTAFSSPVFDTLGVTTVSCIPAGLHSGGLYYWRVQAINFFGNGSWAATRQFATAGALPEAPVLISPAHLATKVKMPMNLSWSAQQTVAHYHVQVSKDSLFTSPIIDRQELPPPIASITGLDYNSTYYWRVSATNVAGTGPWSLVWSFTTAERDTLPKPVLIAPPNGDTTITMRPKLSWNGPGASQYTVHISTDAGFSTTGYDSTLSSSTAYILMNTLKAFTQYYWKVRSIRAADTSHWSDVWSFTTVPDVLETPVLISPVNKSIEVPADTLLVWGSIAYAASYRMQLSSWASKPPTVILDTILSATSCAVRNLPLSTQYSWGVLASNTYGSSEWSTVWTFNTILVPPGVTMLSYPKDSSRGNGSLVNLRWLPNSEEVWYRIQLATDDQFATLLLDTTNVTQTDCRVFSLSPATTFFWRVRAENKAGAGPWSKVWKFTTLPVVGVAADRHPAPAGIVLEQNYPNPFHDHTTIAFAATGGSKVVGSLRVYDVLGRVVAVLFENREIRGPGSAVFDAAKGLTPIPPGMYVCCFSADGLVMTRTMLLAP